MEKNKVGWPWRHNVLLWFKKPYHGLDQVGDRFYRVTAKYLFGKVYIVAAEEWTENREMMISPAFRWNPPADPGERGGR